MATWGKGVISICSGEPARTLAIWVSVSIFWALNSAKEYIMDEYLGMASCSLSGAHLLFKISDAGRSCGIFIVFYIKILNILRTML